MRFREGELTGKVAQKGRRFKQIKTQDWWICFLPWWRNTLFWCHL